MLDKLAQQSLKALLHKNQVFTDMASRLSYEADGGIDRAVPDGVVLPQSAQDVTRVMDWAAQQGVPLVGRGAGTGLSGGAVAEHGGLILEFSRMNHLLEIDVWGRTALVEPGLINLRLDEQARERDLYFPPDPASQRASTIGGNVSENSGGPHCFKYGVTTNYIMGMQVVLADGRIAQVGGPAFDYPAYDLCGLLTGSEGTLALMTAITARLVRNPPAAQTLLAVFDSVEQAGKAVSAVIAAGLVPATMEMMDQKITRIVEDYVHAGLPIDAEAILIIDMDGYPASLDAQSAEIARILQAHGGYNLRTAQSAEERAQIWFARKSAAGALAKLSPAQYTIDITVPRSRLAEALVEVNEICDRHQLRVGYVFHAGDGNLHPLILIPDPQDKALMARVLAAGRETVEVAVRKNGSLSGEHGIGIEKRAFMPLMFNEAEMSAMLDIKHVFDPQNLLNPGKIFPESPSTQTTELSPRLPNDPSVQTVTNAIAPASVAETSRLLQDCTQARQPVHITSKTGDIHTSNHVTLSTSVLRGIISYAPEDMYITVGAGTPLSEVQEFLAVHGQQVPLASPWPDATIGGLVAANTNAPLRMRYGAIRDLVLCATVALADGRIIRAGRPVIKNVAGYDLVKLFVGSRGTLGLLTDITLKVFGLTRARRSLVVPFDDLRYGLIQARQLYPRSLVASAILLVSSEHILETIQHVPGNIPTPHIRDTFKGCPYTLIYTVEGLAEDVQAEIEQVRAALQADEAAGVALGEPVEIEGISGTDVWTHFLGQASKAVQLRIGLPVRDLPVYVQDQATLLAGGDFLVDYASGFVYCLLPAQDVASVAKTVEQLRASTLQAGGYAIVTHLPDEWTGIIDRWGYLPDTLDMMRKLKARWDPAGILNSGEFVV
ncbi:MAG TPA: FAD-linked oxidase C-terminal domain-containing protein [Ktedonobacteraceae bacterium]|nr:FAD-linked oxidase C-terminal domain-containing protein [Ktedonobacteraceae bacterium]